MMAKKDKPPETEDPETKKLLDLWNRVDRLYWKRTNDILIGLAIGVSISAIMTVLLIGFYLFMQIK
jgi:hypothetical protein